jgi:hypothetical protein
LAVAVDKRVVSAEECTHVFSAILMWERFDGLQRHHEEFYWTTTIADTITKKEWFVVNQGNLVECYIRPWNRTLPHPNFDRARFRGKAEINNRVVDHWVEVSPEGREVAQVYDTSDGQEIVRIDIEHRGRALAVHFHELDVGTQNPSLWVLPDAINAICTNVPAEGKFHGFLN